MDVQEFEQKLEEKFHAIFGKGVAQVRDDLVEAKARLLSLENRAVEAAQLELARAERELALAQALEPALGEKAKDVIAAAEAGLAAVQAFVQRVTGGQGM
jgi:hypothetical protein